MSCFDPTKESEIEALKSDQTALRLEILEMNRKQEDSLNQITSFEERIRCAECKQQQILSFIVKIAKYPNFVQKLVQKRKQVRELDGIDSAKRPRLPTQQRHVISMQPELSDEMLLDVDDRLCGGIEDYLDDGNVIHRDGDANSNEEEICVNDSQIFQELEDLIEKPRGWAIGPLVG